jgi:ELWxxDGT repeat protein
MMKIQIQNKPEMTFLPARIAGLKWLMLLLVAGLLSACGAVTQSESSGDLTAGMASVTVSVNGSQSRAGRSQSSAERPAGVPSEVTSLQIEIVDSRSRRQDVAELIDGDGSATLIVRAGDNYTLRGTAKAGDEILFQGETTIESLRAGAAVTINLTLQDQVQLTLTPLPDIEIGVGAAAVSFNLQGLDNQAIIWSVNDVAGGSAAFGTIDDNGNYSPPAVLPANPTITIHATPLVSAYFAQSFSFDLLPGDNINNAPQASAGNDQSVNEGAAVTLTAAASNDSDGAIVSYAWLQTSGASVTLSDSSAISPTFTAPVLTTPDTLSFQLSVTDNEGASASDTVSIKVNPVNATPLAAAGADVTVSASAVVSLNGSGSSDGDGSIVRFSWSRVSGDFDPTLGNADAAIASFTTPALQYGGVAVFQLEVTDNEGASASDQITVTVLGTDQALVAHAGSDQTVTENTLVTLDGTASNDPDNVITAYVWEELSAGGIVLSDNTLAMPTFNAPAVSASTNFQFRLSVTNDHGDSAQDVVTITVNPAVVVNARVFFAASSDGFTHNIWVSDGTAGGTLQVASVRMDNINLHEFKTIGDVFYFQGDDGSNGRELWRSDGTAAGTEMLSVAADADYVQFGAATSADPGQFTVLGDRLLLSAMTSNDGTFNYFEYLSLDTTASAVTPSDFAHVFSAAPYSGSGSLNRQQGVMNGYVYFANRAFTPTVVNSLYRTDGINAAELVASSLSSPDTHDFTELNGELFFVIGSKQLWKTDGVTTTLLKTFVNHVGFSTSSSLSQPYNGGMIVHDNHLFFVADDGQGSELWKSNGLSGNAPDTVLVADLDGNPAASTYPYEFREVNGKLLFFSGEGAAATDGLWVTDGTAAGTQRIAALGVNRSDSGYFAEGYNTTMAQVLTIGGQQRLFFMANDGTNGNELWTSDGSAVGTSMVKDIRTTGSSFPALFMPANDELFFSAQDDDGRAKLWKTDGTASGTTLVLDVCSSCFGQGVFFRAFD